MFNHSLSLPPPAPRLIQRRWPPRGTPPPLLSLSRRLLLPLPSPALLPAQLAATGSSSAAAAAAGTSTTSYSSLLLAIASENSEYTCSRGRAPRSPPLRARSDSVRSSTSFSPTTAMMGIFCCSALRICLARRSAPRSTSTRMPCRAASAFTCRQKSMTLSVTGSRRICTGDSHSGKSPALFSTRMPKKRSSDPKIARWTMTGRLRSPSLETYSRSKRSGRLKSHCTVEHCQVRPMASRILMSILGP
mmetsp:Transcript_34527/g.56452  ORF Transcript_34527/g.56452 Transcript_34527/m.56452 type:complete len:247 (+) Transcript_34527:413-1153(+)